MPAFVSIREMTWLNEHKHDTFNFIINYNEDKLVTCGIIRGPWMTASWLFWGWSWGSDHSDARTGWPTAHLQEVTGGTKCDFDMKTK